MRLLPNFIIVAVGLCAQTTNAAKPPNILFGITTPIRAQGTGSKQDFLDQMALVLNEPLSDVKNSSHVSTPRE